MSSSTISLAQQFKFQVWNRYIRNLSHEETQKLLLIAVRQAIKCDRPAGKLKQQNLENYIRSLNKEKAQDILLRAIRSHMLEM